MASATQTHDGCSALQVPETFDATSYEQALSAIHEEVQDVALSEEKLDLVLRLANELSALVKARFFSQWLSSSQDMAMPNVMLLASCIWSHHQRCTENKCAMVFDLGRCHSTVNFHDDRKIQASGIKIMRQDLTAMNVCRVKSRLS